MRCGQGSAPELAAELTDLLAGFTGEYKDVAGERGEGKYRRGREKGWGCAVLKKIKKPCHKGLGICRFNTYNLNICVSALETKTLCY